MWLAGQASANIGEFVGQMQSFVVMAQLSSDQVPESVRSFGNALDWTALQIVPPWVAVNESCTAGNPCGRRLLSEDGDALLNIPDKFLGMCIFGLGGMLFFSCVHLLIICILVRLQLPIPGQPHCHIDTSSSQVREQVVQLSLT